MLAQLIPGGRFLMGLSCEEEAAARRICDPLPFDPNYLRPHHEEEVAPILVSQQPVLTGTFERWMNVCISANGVLRSDDPANVEIQAAVDFASLFGARLPFEREWEYMCRAMTNTLFWWGNELPGIADLESYVAFYKRKKEIKYRFNQFGLLGMHVTHWCQDLYRDTYDVNAPSQADIYVIRGGGSDSWPWQRNCHEWLFCMSSARSRGVWRYDFMDKICGFRVVWDIAHWWE